MISCLQFQRPLLTQAGNMVAEKTFVPRSTLPLTAICYIANGIREKFSQILATDFDVEVIEPIIPDAIARRTLFYDALVLTVNGRAGDAFIVIRGRDARRLIGLAYGESERVENTALSEVESRTLERLIDTIPPLCTSLCGSFVCASREMARRGEQEAQVYFEIRTKRKPRITIGFALVHDPGEAVVERIDPRSIAEIPLEIQVRSDVGAMRLMALRTTQRGSIFPITSDVDRAYFAVDGKALARGSCGIVGSVHALRLDAGIAQRGSMYGT